jgi:hypothetical protein
MTLGGLNVVQGVFPVGTHSVLIKDAVSHVTQVNLSSDGGYVVQLAAPATALTYVERDGTVHQQVLR